MPMSHAKGAPTFIEQEFARKVEGLLKKTGEVTEENFLEFMFSFGRQAKHFQVSYGKAVERLWGSVPEEITDRVQGLFENGKPYPGEEIEHITFLGQTWVPVSGREALAFGTGLHPPGYRTTALWGRVAGHGVPTGGVAKHAEGQYVTPNTKLK